MKLKSSKDKKGTRRKKILISLGVITIVGVSLLLYKTFASFSKKANLDNVLFGFYNGEEKLSEMPQKGNPDNLVFEKAVCDNGASIEWDNEKWAPLVKGLTKTKTKCTLYFAVPKAKFPGVAIPIAAEGQDGLYAVEHNNLTELDSSWNKTEYRFAGKDPNNYVEFNNEKWRIIGLVNVKTATGVEQRIKIIRTDGIEGQKDFGNYSWDKNESDATNNWTTSKLKDMLNGIYYNSEKGDCYAGNDGGESVLSECDFNSGLKLPKGLNEIARNMIDENIIWNIGGWHTNAITTDNMYEKERGMNTGNNNDYSHIWSKELDENYHRGIGLMYPSDYGYAVGRELRKSCLKGTIYDYRIDCYLSDWLKASSKFLLLLSPNTSTSDYSYGINISGYIGTGYIVKNLAYRIWPTLYLNTSTTIYDGDGSFDNPFLLSVQ